MSGVTGAGKATGREAELDEAFAALARDMRAHGYRRDDPMREIFALLGDRWSMLILLVLGAKPCRHAELRRVLGALSAEGRISQRVLTLKLRVLERDGLVERSVSDDVPPKVGYALSAMGAEMLGEANRLMAWIKDNGAQIEGARAIFDKTEG